MHRTRPRGPTSRSSALSVGTPPRYLRGRLDATGRFRSTTPAEGTGAERLRAHLAILAARIAAEPELHIVPRELDLRAKRDAELHATIQAHERGWRESLTAAADLARREGALNPAVTPETAAELIISTVKGASLNAATAGAVCGGLAALLTGSAG